MPNSFNVPAVEGDPSNRLIIMSCMTPLQRFIESRRYASDSLQMENGTKERCWVQPNFTHMCSPDVECHSPPAHKQSSVCVLDDDFALAKKKQQKNKIQFRQVSAASLDMKEAGMRIFLKNQHVCSLWCTAPIKFLFYFWWIFKDYNRLLFFSGLIYCYNLMWYNFRTCYLDGIVWAVLGSLFDANFFH